MKKFFPIVIILLMASGTRAAAQPLMDTVENAYLNTGGKIFSHRMGFAGIVEWDGEEIPWYEIATVYIFPPLVFSNAAEARRYYQIANNIKKVYPIAVQISYDVKHHIA